MNRRTFLKYLGLGSLVAVVPAVVESKTEDILDLVNDAIDNQTGSLDNVGYTLSKEASYDIGGYLVPDDIADDIKQKLSVSTQEWIQAKDGRYHHYITIKDGEEFTNYVDGKKFMNYKGQAFPFSEHMRDVALYNKALTQSQIDNHYAAFIGELT